MFLVDVLEVVVVKAVTDRDTGRTACAVRTNAKHPMARLQKLLRRFIVLFSYVSFLPKHSSIIILSIVCVTVVVSLRLRCID